jgi:hypothetical protein
VTLHRLPDGAAGAGVQSLAVARCRLLDVGLRCGAARRRRSLVAPGSASGPVELVASVNGTPFRVLAESISRERVFGDASIRISGRGRNAVLAAPYAPVMNFQHRRRALRGS